ncbi:MAG TPA: DnaA/Hda family protein [Longimicrobium sp.]|nr:DnaA/Hda family protein [Longimicrobium sp.]
MRFEQDPRFTFDTYVVGPGNRMAAAAARRAAESPGTSYNPLYVYGAPGVGKTHLLHALAAHGRAVRPELRVDYRTADALVDDVSSAVAAGNVDAFRDTLLEAGLLLIDGAHRLAAKQRTQEELLAVWDDLLRAGTQVVVAAERPPAELEGVDERLKAKLAGGLVVDAGRPDAETRLAIVRQGAEARGMALASGVDDLLANLPLEGARELHAGLDRIARVQSDEGRSVEAAEVAGIVGVGGGEPAPLDEFSAFLSDIAFTVEQLVETDPWRKRLAEAILRYEGEGVRTRRLEAALDADSAPNVDALLEGFAKDVERLRAVRKELAEVDAEAAHASVLADPDRVPEAEAILLSAKAAAERKAEAAPPAPPVDRWYFNNAEKVAWTWLALEDRVIEELA